MSKKILFAGAGIIITLILIGISFSYGYRLRVKEESRILDIETSKVIKVQHALAFGEVTDILNRTLTLIANGDTLAIPIIEGAEVIAFVLEENVEEGMKFERKEMEFKDIKIGDKVEILIRFKPDDYFEGIDVTILTE